MLLNPYRFGSGTAPIAPNAIGGLKLWLDAQVGVFKAGIAAQFTIANSEYLSRASNSSLQTGDIDWTIAGWFKFDGGGSQCIVSKDSATSGKREYQLTYFVGPTNAVLGQVFTATDVARQVSSAGIPTANTWFFFTFWHDAAANTINLEFNANGSIISTNTTGALQAASDAEFRLGSNAFSGSPLYLGGAEQAIGFWKRTLTSGEKTFLYNSGNGRNYSELSAGDKTSMVSWWALNETSGTRNDSHGTNHLTDNNTVTSSIGPVLPGTTAGSGDFVGDWRDQSGLNSHAYTRNGSAPTLSTSVASLNSQNALNFNAGPFMASAESAAVKPFTFALVVRPASLASTRTFVGNNLGTGVNIQFIASNVWAIGVGGVQVGAGDALSASTSYILFVSYDGLGNYVYRKNSAAVSSGTNNQTPAASITWIGLSGAGLFPADSLIAEVIKYDNVISAGDRSGLEAYLSAKYGIV